VISRERDKITISGDMTFDEANELVAMTPELCRDHQATIDLSSVKRVDSSAVGVLLTWLREARKRRCVLKLENVPPNLMSLAEVYGVARFFDSASSP
jgi:anti-anti-sigma factor